MSAGASAGAAAAAAEEQRRQMQEEEEMTGYRADELTQDYEFKILRSATGAFRRSERLQQILEEEARCGWTLVEKFDNSRVRLKRPASARDLDGKRGLDAYRTYVGPSPNVLGLAIAATIVGVMLGVILLLGMW